MRIKHHNNYNWSAKVNEIINLQTATNTLITANNSSQPIKNNFGELITAQLVPVIQDYTPYGIINEQLFISFTATGGQVAASPNGNEVDISITNSIGSFGVLRSKRVLKYRPGYSLVARMNARFDSNAVANSLQFAGVGNSDCDLYFCMNGTDFGVRRSTGGGLEVRELTINSSATGSETATITLNGTAFTVDLTNAGGDIDFSSYEISQGAYTGWTVEHINGSVIFIGGSVGSRPGSYSFSSATATATFAQTHIGTALTTEFVAQADWNGSSDMTTNANPFLRNMYQVEYSWYGSGSISFQMLNPDTGRYEEVHMMKFANISNELSLSEPNMYIQRGVASLGSTTALTMHTAGSFGAIYGQFSRLEPRQSIAVSKSLSSNTEKVMCALKNRLSINGFPNQSEILLSSISVAADGNRVVVIRIIKNPDSLGAGTTSDYADFQYIDKPNSISIVDTTAITYTGGTTLFTYVVGKNLSNTLELEDKEIYLSKEDVLLITAESSATNTVDLSVSFLEDL